MFQSTFAFLRRHYGSISMGIVVVVLIFAFVMRQGLLFVDFISFSERAQRISIGDDLIHPLYPVGYPALLLVAKLIVGDVVLAGKLISFASAIFLAHVFGRRFGAGAGLSLLGLGGFIIWGSTPGTDMIAATFTLSSIFVADKRPVLTGVYASLALLCRYSALPLLPVILWRSSHRLKTLATVLIATSPHWAFAMFEGRSPLFDQSENLMRGGDYMGTILQLMRDVFSEPLALLGLIGLLAACRMETVARDIGLFVLLTCLMIGFVFSNPRLALPIHLSLAAGTAFWLGRYRRLAPIALGVGLWQAPLTIPTEPVMNVNHFSREAGLKRPFYTSSPWVFGREDGFVVGGLPLSTIGRPHLLTIEEVVDSMRHNGIERLVIHRSLRPYIKLSTLLNEDVDGLTLEHRHGDWVLYGLTSNSD